jgi:hypothetical protein
MTKQANDTMNHGRRYFHCSLIASHLIAQRPARVGVLLQARTLGNDRLRHDPIEIGAQRVGAVAEEGASAAHAATAASQAP